MSTRREELELLLVQRATEGLDARETVRLNQLLAEHPEVDESWVDRLVGELDAATARDAGLALDPGLRRALLDAAPAAASGAGDADGTRPGVTPEVRPARMVTWGGWMLAAAVAGLWLLSPDAGPATGPEAGMDGTGGTVASVEAPGGSAVTFGTIASADDAVTATWSPGPDETGSRVSGEVVWSRDAQAGVMRLAGLRVNPPAEYQYQLWIFDRNRDERYPVDGGVFDMPPGGTADIPIRAKLPVDRAILFAVTVERPGGVVVSDRDRIATVAEVTAAAD